MSSDVRFGRSMRWIGATRASVVTVVVTATAVTLSVLLCQVLFWAFGLPFQPGTRIAWLMLTLPIAVPLLVAPLTCLPVARTVRHNVELVREIDQTRARLEGEIAVRESLQRELEAQALGDPLTGLLNRRGFFQMVALDDRPASTVLVLDVDGLKPVNDGWGHASGDLVLRAVADVLRSVFGPDAIAARLGGDEFVVLVDDTLASGEVAAAVRDALATVRLDGPPGVPTGVSASVGSAAFGPGISIDTALALADRRMYAQKRRSSAPRSPARS